MAMKPVPMPKPRPGDEGKPPIVTIMPVKPKPAAGSTIDALKMRMDDMRNKSASKRASKSNALKMKMDEMRNRGGK